MHLGSRECAGGTEDSSPMRGKQTGKIEQRAGRTVAHGDPGAHCYRDGASPPKTIWQMAPTGQVKAAAHGTGAPNRSGFSRSPREAELPPRCGIEKGANPGLQRYNLLKQSSAQWSPLSPLSLLCRTKILA
jgi:hypothetical protein